jgi:hypothetical protein
MIERLNCSISPPENGVITEKGFVIWIDKACRRIPVAEIYGRIAVYLQYRAFDGIKELTCKE